MENEKIRLEIDELRKQVDKCQYEYYVEANPTLSDIEYDKIFDRLLELEAAYPEFDSVDSPTKRVGSDLSQDFPFFDHKIPVLSLDKCYSVQELTEWVEKVRKNADREISFVVEEKIDGASIVLYYEKGVLTNAVTRGNGSVGNDVTGNVKTIKSIPLKLPEPVTLTVRGEIFLAKSNFEKINKTMETPYANPRNLASGTLRRIKSAEVARVPLDIFVYEGFFAEPLDEHTTILEKLHDLGFKLNKRTGFFTGKEHRTNPVYHTSAPEELAAFVEQEIRERNSLEYEIDGLVLKINEIDEREVLGYTGHHPRWAIAFKFESPQGISTVEEIVVQVGRTGRITPVANIAPVEISGSTISRVTLHNQDYIDLLELGVGDKIVVEKRGDVIPSAARVLEHSDNHVFKLPENCPCCGSVLEKRGAHHFCPNMDCADIVRGRVQFFAAKGQMDIENLGGETVTFLLDNNIIKDIDDIYTFNPDELLNFPGFGEKKVKQIKEGIAKSKERPYIRLLPSLGIPDLGPKAAELLIGAGIRDMDALLALADKNDTATLEAIHGMGEITAESILAELKDPSNRRRIEALRKAGLIFAAEEQAVLPVEEQIFKDQAWCVTGSFENFKPRELAMEEVKKRGGRVVSGVTSKTTHLLAGEGGGSKLKKAQELGITVVSEEEFLKILEG